jgi:hypothetical protein
MEDDTNLPAEDLPVEEAVVEQQEAADAAAEPVEAIAEQEEVAEATEQMFAKFDEIDRMIAYVGQYGVDKSFLSLCNHDDILNQAFNLGLPATESFEEAGDPNSAVSQAAMEGLKEAAKSVWDWIKKAWARIKQFFSDAWDKVTGWFKKTEKKVEDAEKAVAATKGAEEKPDNEKKAKGEATAPEAAKKKANEAAKIADDASKKITLTVKQLSLQSELAQPEEGDAQIVWDTFKKHEKQLARTNLSKLGWNDARAFLSASKDAKAIEKKLDEMVKDAKSSLAEAEGKLKQAQGKYDETALWKMAIKEINNNLAILIKSAHVVGAITTEQANAALAVCNGNLVKKYAGQIDVSA